MEYLVTGASGLIGLNFINILPKSKTRGASYLHTKPGFIQFDIRKHQEVEFHIRNNKPRVIFHSAAFANVDECENNYQECFDINFLGTLNLAKAAKRYGSKIVFLSTDYVFNGKRGPYFEEDIPDPINNYGKSKLAAEHAIQEYCNNYLIIRTTIVYGHEIQGKNFVIRMISQLKNGRKILVPIDQLGTPTYVVDLINTILLLVANNKNGIYNIAGPELIDRYSFACLIADTYGYDRNFIIPISTAELNQNAQRPLRAGLVIEKVKSEVNASINGPIEGLSLMKHEKSNIIDYL
jgi:dTDP-4-dehydrorhamnose reductase